VGLDGVQKLEAIREAFDRWLRERALDDVERFGRQHEAALGVEAAGYRLSDARSRWGSCGRDNVVRVHWRLVQAPTPAFEYVVAHEVAHLLHRNHSPSSGRCWEDAARLGRAEGDARAVGVGAPGVVGGSEWVYDAHRVTHAGSPACGIELARDTASPT
jgi:hypothetical protein